MSHNPKKRRQMIDLVLLVIFVVAVVLFYPRIYHSGTALPNYYQGKELYYDGKLDEAMVLFQKAVKGKPDLGKAHLMIGRVHWDQGDYDQAEKAFLRALQATFDHDNEARTHYNLAVLYLKHMKDVDKSIKHLRASIDAGGRVYEGQGDLYSLLTFLYGMEGRFDEALAVAQEGLTVLPKTADRYFNLVMVYCSMGEYEKALRANQKVLEIDPNYRDAKMYQLQYESGPPGALQQKMQMQMQQSVPQSF